MTCTIISLESVEHFETGISINYDRKIFECESHRTI